MIALIDADILVYRAGFAGQKTVYRFVSSQGETLAFDGMTLAQVKVELKERKITPAHGKLQKLIIPDPIENVLHTAKIMISEILQNTGADTFLVPLTSNDKSNYRFKVAKTLPYKGNRKAPKPRHYQAIRDYLTGYWNAYEVTGIEADDELGILQCNSEEETIICSIDKDLDMIPGLHYNINDKTIYGTSDEDDLLLSNNNRKLSGGGIKWFYAQMLLGDNADNIPGIPGLGPVTAHRELNKLETEEELATRTLEIYKEKQVEGRFYEVADLLWMQRRRGQRKSNELRRILE